MKKESNIKELLDKYLTGETSLKEEKILANYFQNENINPEWSIYKDMFGYFEESKNETTLQVFTPHIKKSKRLFSFFQKYAAVLMIALVGALFYYQQTTKPEELGTYDDPELALQETKKVFDMISYHLNSPSEDMSYLQTLEETQNKYINKIKP